MGSDGNGEWKIGNRKWEIGNRETGNSAAFSSIPNCLFPIPQKRELGTDNWEQTTNNGK